MIRANNLLYTYPGSSSGGEFSLRLAELAIKRGESLAITGPTSDAGNPYSKGVEDYFKFVNDTKILGEDKIDCTIRDDQYKTDITKRNFAA